MRPSAFRASLLPLLILALALGGCGASLQEGAAVARAPAPAQMAADSPSPGRAAGVEEMSATSPTPAPSAMPDAAARSAIGSVVGSSGRSAGPSTANEPTREGGRPAEGPAAMLIYTATVGMLADEDRVAPTIDAIIDAAYALGGYVASRTDTTVTVRIPSAQFRVGLRQVEGLGEVTARSVSTEDVSEEFHDMEVRLQNLRALRQRLEGFFARANTIQEALQVQTELERVAREIDQIEGRMRFLSSRAAFSMVTVNVTARPRPQPVQVNAPPPPPPPPAAVRRIVQVPIDWLGRLGIGRLLDLGTP